MRVQCKTKPTSISFSANGKLLATMGEDRKVWRHPIPALLMAINPHGRRGVWSLQVRVFQADTGKLYRVFNESLATIQELQNTKPQVDSIDFGRRMAVERELEKNPTAFSSINVGMCRKVRLPRRMHRHGVVHV
jgi:hypothetical protein